MVSERNNEKGAARLTLTVREAAHLLGISRGLAYEMARCGGGCRWFVLAVAC